MSGKGGPSVEAQTLFRRMKQVPENDLCFECGRQNPDWASIPNGLLICRDCAGKHRSIGTHLSFVRSINMDSWTDVQLATMRYGGNANALAFFNKYGIADIPNLTNKYGSAAGQAYREKLAALSTGQPWKDPAKDELKKFRAYARPSESMYRDSDTNALEKFLLPKGQPQRTNVQKPADDDFFNFTTSHDPITNDNGVDEREKLDVLNTTTATSTTAPTNRTHSNGQQSPTPTRNANAVPRGGAKVRGRGKGRGALVRKPQPVQAKPVEETFTTEEYDEIWGFSTEGLDVPVETPVVESEIKSDNLVSTLSEATSESIVAI